MMGGNIRIRPLHCLFWPEPDEAKKSGFEWHRRTCWRRDKQNCLVVNKQDGKHDQFLCIIFSCLAVQEFTALWWLKLMVQDYDANTTFHKQITIWQLIKFYRLVLNFKSVVMTVKRRSNEDSVGVDAPHVVTTVTGWGTCQSHTEHLQPPPAWLSAAWHQSLMSTNMETSYETGLWKPH